MSWFTRTLIAATVLGAGCSPKPAAPDGRDVVVIVFDTLREDLRREAKTPTFDALAARGAQVERAWSPGTWTLPAVASLFAGASLREHGWNFPFPSRMEHRTESYPPLPKDRPLLAEVLKGAGFETAGYYSNRILGHGLGYERGFDDWVHTRDKLLSEQVAERVAGWDREDSHFLYLHLRGCHEPLYLSAKERQTWDVDERWFASGGFDISEARDDDDAGGDGVAQYQRAYRSVIEDQDRRLAKLLEALGPRRETALIVVTSDHGELLGEHGRVGHGRWVYEPLTWVPFIAANLPASVGALPERMSTAALPDLITRSLGLAGQWPVRVDDDGPLVSQRTDRFALSPDGRVKGIWHPSAEPELSVYDLSADPGEEQPLEAPPDLAAQRQRWEAATPQTVLEEQDAGMGDALIEALEALGYFEGE